MKKKLILIIICLLLPVTVFAETETVVLEKCVDGDTAKFKSTDGTITTYRFLAIDTPETVHPTKEVEPWGKEASDYTCMTLENASVITLEFDDNAGKVDKYGRGLAWVFADDIFLQEQLVMKGYAEVAYLYGDYKYNDLLKDTEAVAKASKLGIWSDENQTIQNEDTNIDKTEATNSKKNNFWESILDNVLDTIVASLNKMIDSILQRLEDML